MDDVHLRQAVLDALNVAPDVFAADIRVSVDRGIVTLSGHVSTYSAKMKAASVVTRTRDVMAVAQRIEIRPYRANPVMGGEGAWSSLLD